MEAKLSFYRAIEKEDLYPHSAKLLTDESAFCYYRVYASVWNIRDGYEISNAPLLLGANHGVVTLSSDGQLLAIARNIYSWDSNMQDWREKPAVGLYQIPGYKQSASLDLINWPYVNVMMDGTVRFEERYLVHVIRFSPNGDLLALGRADGTISLWNLQDFSEEILSIMSNENQTFYKSKSIYSFDERDAFVREIRNFGVSCLEFSNDGELLAAGFGNKVKIFDLQTKKVVAMIKGPSEVWCLQFSPHNRYLAIGYDNGGLHLFDIDRQSAFNTSLKWENTRVGGLINGIVFTPNGKLILCGDRFGKIRLLETETGKMLISQTCNPNSNDEHPIIGITINQQGDLIGVVARNVYFWRLTFKSGIFKLW